MTLTSDSSTSEARSDVTALTDPSVSASGGLTRRQRRTARRSNRSTRYRTIRTAILMVFGVIAATTTWSLGSYVIDPKGDTRQARAVSWARDHHLGRLVDFAERHKYGKAPSQSKAASDLALGELPTTSASTTTTVAALITTTTTATPNAPSTIAATTIPPTTTTIAAWQIAPAAIAPRVDPPLENEGVWTGIAKAKGVDVVWATSLRPLPAYPSVVGSFAIIDQTATFAAMFNGNDIPGGRDWSLTNRVPADHHPALMAAFNGGFRFEHIKGGYKNEGRSVRPLLNGEATIAVDRKGKIVIGEFGRDIVDDGSYISFRQNLPLLVDGGVAKVADHKGTWWGADYGDVIFVVRSSVCVLADGRLMYGSVGRVDANLLAETLVSMGCVRGMQLDINGQWPTFQVFPTGDDGAKHGAFLDSRMGGNRDRYLTGSTREFFAFFDPTQFPAESVVVLQTLRDINLPPASTTASTPATAGSTSTAPAITAKP
jgi:hypothetical protein